MTFWKRSEWKSLLIYCDPQANLPDTTNAD